MPLGSIVRSNGTAGPIGSSLRDVKITGCQHLKLSVSRKEAMRELVHRSFRDLTRDYLAQAPNILNGLIQIRVFPSPVILTLCPDKWLGFSSQAWVSIFNITV